MNLLNQLLIYPIKLITNYYITDIKSYTIIKNIKKEIDNQHALSIFKKSFYDPQTTSILLISRNIPVIYAYYNEFLFNRDKDNRV